MTLLYTRPPRSALIVITVIALVLASTLPFPPSWGHPLQLSSSFYRSKTKSIVSSWNVDSGWLHYEAGNEWGTSYDLLLSESAEEVGCDEVREAGNGRIMCRSGIKVLKNIYRNAQAQVGYLQEKGIPAGAEKDMEFADSSDSLSGIAGKRILVIGDSLDRDWITQLVDLTSPSSFYSNFDLSSYTSPDDVEVIHHPRSSSMNGRAIVMKHECGSAIIPIAANPSLSSTFDTLEAEFTPRYTADRPRPSHHFRIDFAFVFGLLNIGQAPTLPANTTHRLDALREIIGGDVSDKNDKGYDAITLNFGLWDLVGYQRRAYLADLSDHNPGFTSEWILEYIQACERFIKDLRATYGQRVPIFSRLVHDTGPGNVGLGLPAEITAAAGRQAPFKPLRVAQLRKAQIEVARRMDLKLLNFASRFEGYGMSYMQDGTHPVVSANKVHTEMVLRSLIEL